MSKRMWWYLENSEIPDLNYTNAEDVEEYLEMHRTKGNKSSIIISEQSILEMYMKMKADHKPVYIGKDIISKSYNGYTVLDCFPNSVFINSQYYFQSGIQEWWQKHLSWSIIIKTNVNATSILDQNTSSNHITQT